jgi:hypothetical protein
MAGPGTQCSAAKYDTQSCLGVRSLIKRAFVVGPGGSSRNGAASAPLIHRYARDDDSLGTVPAIEPID